MIKGRVNSVMTSAGVRRRSVWLPLLVLVTAGCGPSRPPTVKVTGTVIYRGSPVSAADVNFIPADGRPASGRTDEQGRFTLTTFVAGDGVLPGEHVVTVGKQEPKNTVNQGNTADQGLYIDYVDVLPAKYTSIKESPLRATVEATGSRDFIFELD
jgi:hypothetical protein